MKEEDRRAGIRLLETFGVNVCRPNLQSLRDIYEAFRRLPYENLTKFLRKHSTDPPSRWPRFPGEVVHDYLAWRSGGTCFSLTKLLETILLELGYECHPVLADMPHGEEIHCALVVVVRGKRFLLDPSYLLPDPMELPRSGRSTLESPANRLVLASGNQSYQLFTQKAGQLPKWRYSFTDEPADPRHFLERWIDSFTQTMMNSLVMTTLSAGRQLYLHNDRLQEVTASSRRTTAIRGDFPHALRDLFGVEVSLAQKAHEVWLDARERAHVAEAPGSRRAREQRSRGP